MSGHSKWAGIKHKKGAIDAKRSKVFTRIIREITIAARLGGGVLENNPRLRKATESAHEANMPSDNIKKAIQRGTGELPGVNYEELMYEGYGAGGVAMLVEITTDNKNRTASDIRKIFSDHAGNLGESGCVAWMFHPKGYLTIEKNKVAEDKLFNLALEAGAEDIKADGSEFEVITPVDHFEKVKAAIQTEKIPILSAEITMMPQNTVRVEGNVAEKIVALMNELEEHEDVKTVSANFDIPDEIMEKLSAA